MVNIDMGDAGVRADSRRTGLLGVILLCAAALTLAPLAARAATTERVSVDSDHIEAEARSGNPAVSADGRFVAFDSDAENLVAGDTNNTTDVFVHDRQTGATTRVSVGPMGAQANGVSFRPSISDDGRYVAFVSAATNLVMGDSNAQLDIYVRDRQDGTTTLVSVDSGGGLSDGLSDVPVMAGNGCCVAFESAATNLVSGDSNGERDIFVHDRMSGQTTRVSVGLMGGEGNGRSLMGGLSADGRYVAFGSEADNLVADDTNGVRDVFVHDRLMQQTRRVSVNTQGMQGNDASSEVRISGNGRYLAFGSAATNLVAGDSNGVNDVFVFDQVAAQTTRVSVDSSGAQANSLSFPTGVSRSGRYVSFLSFAGNLVAGDGNSVADVFVRDRDSGQTSRVNVDASGAEAAARAFESTLSADGRFAVFASGANNLVPWDGNAAQDVFVRGPLLPGLGETRTLSAASSAAAFFGGVSADGGRTFAQIFTTGDSLDVLADIGIDPADVGSQGALYVVAVYEGFLFYKHAGGFAVWDGTLAGLQPAVGPRPLNAFEGVEIVRGLSGIPGTFAVIVGYQDASGDIHFHGTPIVFTVTAL